MEYRKMDRTDERTVRNDSSINADDLVVYDSYGLLCMLRPEGINLGTTHSVNGVLHQEGAEGYRVYEYDRREGRFRRTYKVLTAAEAQHLL